ncbi:MAG: hypothetical protein JO142_07910 [Burkholderiales bacterium]|nr:hypothetical protein [Burkholderiales bacterium]
MQELNVSEIEQVNGGISGSTFWGFMFNATKIIGDAVYNSGMNAREAGLGNEYLSALNGGNLGA